jgi:branched-subunit amino acid ABC-type transport system permease component
LIVGLMQSYGALFFPNAYLFLIYLIMALVLLFRPRGLLGRA